MWEALCITAVITQVLILGILSWGAYEYIRLWRRLAIVTTKLQGIQSRLVCYTKMDCDELIDQLLDAPKDGVATATPLLPESKHVTETAGTAVPNTCSAQSACAQRRRERLAALAAGGQARQYLGRTLTADQIDSMGDEEIEKLYARYEARLGAAMTKTLGQAALQVYSGVASMFLPITPESQPALVADLAADPFVGHALSSATCELYHRYGMYLAPITAALTTAKYCHFGHTCPRTIVAAELQENNVGRERDEREDSACAHGESDCAHTGC